MNEKLGKSLNLTVAYAEAKFNTIRKCEGKSCEYKEGLRDGIELQHELDQKVINIHLKGKKLVSKKENS